MSLPMLTSIKVQNLLSFGPEGIDLELPALTVLIGPNGSGKSNLLEVVGLLKATPRDLAAPVRESGGIRNWIWQGRDDELQTASVLTDQSCVLADGSIRHRIEIFESGQRLRVSGEHLRFPWKGLIREGPEFVWERDWMAAVRKTLSSGDEQSSEERQVAMDKSLLSEIKDAVQFPELDAVSYLYNRISLYRRWEFGPNAQVRRPQSIDVAPHPLAEDFSNLGMFLNRIRQHPRPKMEMFEKLSDIYSGLNDFELNIEGGTVQIFFTEGEFSIPATRLSDGSLRYLCLLAILLDPEPPSLVCIEEPELGFHPDLIPKLADLLVDASSRCQVIVTTHSDILVDALSDRPESVVVCEKHDGQTSMRRLDRSDLAVWLEKYRLGELWTRGQLGGVRW